MIIIYYIILLQVNIKNNNNNNNNKNNNNNNKIMILLSQKYYNVKQIIKLNNYVNINKFNIIYINNQISKKYQITQLLILKNNGYKYYEKI